MITLVSIEFIFWFGLVYIIYILIKLVPIHGTNLSKLTVKSVICESMCVNKIQ